MRLSDWSRLSLDAVHGISQEPCYGTVAFFKEI